MPKRLFKYDAFTTRMLLNLKGQILYFGPTSGFNDPYDCAIVPNVLKPTPQEVRRYREEYRARPEYNLEMSKWDALASDEQIADVILNAAQKTLSQNLSQYMTKVGITCFSEKHDDLLMWSHYGGRCKGVCLEFDANTEPFSRAKPVEYISSIPEISISELLWSTDHRPIERLFRAKSTSWQYECEWRATHVQAGTEYVYPAESLTGIYFGPDIDFASIEIVCLILAGQNEKVNLYRGSRSPKEFKVLFEPFTYTSHLDARRLGKLTHERH